uniref:E3 ubiquitin-protein ligase RHA2A-like n=1 Tax=Erigeron canadensis TaxID=72917 RepID=UPI001CB8904B|nr:E3 ubiquitin-protein ligase RHA2A-like [Erigeron canadensis]
MGLQNQLTDISSDSVPVFLLAVIANGVSYLRSLLYTFLHTLGIISRHQSDHDVMDDSLFFDAVGSGLAGLILLADQLNLNNVISYKYQTTSDLVANNHNFTECVVCLNTLTNGEQVRKLDCHHVFHKECFDGWLDHLNFNCPLCRSPLVSDERVAITRRRLADDVMDWFSLRW